MFVFCLQDGTASEKVKKSKKKAKKLKRTKSQPDAAVIDIPTVEEDEFDSRFTDTPGDTMSHKIHVRAKNDEDEDEDEFVGV